MFEIVLDIENFPNPNPNLTFFDFAFSFFLTSTFEILFPIFFFNDHSILWVIQYIHTTIAADSVIPLDT